jgi:hypothetical protein
MSQLEEVYDVQVPEDKIPVVRISRLCKESGCSAQELRVLAVEHGVRIMREGSMVFVPVDNIQRLLDIGKAHVRRDEAMFGPRKIPSAISMLPPRTIRIKS